MLTNYMLKTHFDVFLDCGIGVRVIRPKITEDFKAFKIAGSYLDNCIRHGPGKYNPQHFYFLISGDNAFHLCIYLDPIFFKGLIINDPDTFHNEIRAVSNKAVDSLYFESLKKLAQKLGYDEQLVLAACGKANGSFRLIRTSEYDE